MKFFSILFFCILIHQQKSSIILKRVGNKTIPESNKLQIQFQRDGQPISITTNHKISSLKSDTDVQIDKSIYEDGLEGEDDFDIYDEEHDEHHHEHEHEYDHDYEHEHGHEHDHIFPGIGHDQDPHLGFLDDIQQQIFDLSSQPLTQEDKHLNVAYSQLNELEDSLKDVLYKTEGKTAVMMDPQVLQTLVSYLEHLDYIHKQENGGTKELPPRIPDHLRSEGIEINEEEPNVVTRKKVEDIEAEIEAEITEKQHEKDQENNKIHEEQEEQFSLEKQIENLRAEIDNLKQNGEESNADIIKQKEEEIEELEKEIKTKQEEENIVKTEEELNQTEIEIDQAEETVEKQNQDQNLIDTLDKEKQQLEDQEKKLDEEEKEYQTLDEVQERLIKVEEQLSHLLESQPESSLVEEFEEEKKKLLIKEEQLKENIGKSQHSEELSHEHEGSHEHEDGHEHEGSQEHEGNQEHEGSQENEGSHEHEGSQEHEEGHEHEGSQENEGSQEVTEGDENKDMQLDEYSKQEINKEPTIDDVNKLELRLDQMKKQLNELFKDLPKNENDIPSDIVNEYKSGLLLYQELQVFNTNFQTQKKIFHGNAFYLTERMAQIKLDFNSILEFYKKLDRYNELVENINKDDSNFILKQEETKVIANQFATHIDSATKNVTSIKNILELIQSNLEPIESEKEEKDEDIDMIQKVELTFKLMPTLMELKNQFFTAIKETQMAFTRILQKQSQIEGIMQTLAKIGRGELKDKLQTIEENAEKKDQSASLSINIVKVMTSILLLISF